MKNSNVQYVTLKQRSLKYNLADLFPELSDSELDALAVKVVADNDGLLPNIYQYTVGTTIKVLPLPTKVVIDETPAQG
jgi:hypothetical protein